jgi:hypothetical protein
MVNLHYLLYTILKMKSSLTSQAAEPSEVTGDWGGGGVTAKILFKLLCFIFRGTTHSNLK